MESSTVTFWTLIAQLVPVLALALVIEVRYLSERFLAAPPWKRGSKQALWGFSIFIAMTLMASTFILSLLIALPNFLAPSWADSLMLQVFAVTSTFSGLILVFLFPLSSFVANTTIGAWRRFDARRSFGLTQMRIMRIDYGLDRLHHSRRMWRSALLDENVRFTDYMVKLHRGSLHSVDFSADLECLLHQNDPCDSMEEHHAKEITFFEDLIQLRDKEAGALHSDRIALLRLAVTGTSDYKLKVSRQKLSELLGQIEKEDRDPKRG